MTDVTSNARHQSRNGRPITLTNLINRILLLITLIIRVLLWPVRYVSDLLFPSKEYDGINNTADQAARAFAHNFEKRYLLPNASHINSNETTTTNNNSTSTSISNNTDNHREPVQNPFQSIGYTKSLVESHRQRKILFIYLHSPLHHQSEKFCDRILSHPRVLQQLCTNFVSWGGSIHTADGANIVQMLNVTAYPYVALLACGMNGGSSSSSNGNSSTSRQQQRVDLLWKMEGDNQIPGGVGVDDFLNRINVVLRGFQSVMAEIEMRRLRREEEVRLRQEQDREFQETLLADQRRESERLAQAKAKQEAKEAKEKAERDAILKKEQQIDQCKQMLSPEPDQGTPGTARLRITLPSGNKIDRRFYTTDQIKHVRAFLMVWLYENDVKIENFELSSNYPKKTFSDWEINLEEGGLCPMAVLMVQDLDA